MYRCSDNFYSNFNCLQKDHEQRQQRQQREGPHMVRHQEERVQSTDDWLGAAINASTPLSTPYTRGQRVSMKGWPSLCSVLYTIYSSWLNRHFPFYTFHKQSYEISVCLSCNLKKKSVKSAVTDSYLVQRLHLTCVLLS